MTSIVVSVITTISVVLLFLIRVNATEKMILHLGVLISQKGQLDLSGYIPSMNLALETIKSDKTLPFEFHITLNDSMVSSYVRIYRSRRLDRQQQLTELCRLSRYIRRYLYT